MKNTSRILKRVLSLLLPTAMLIFGNACSPFGANSSFKVSATDTEKLLADIAPASNGRSYDGKLIQYQSRTQVTCDSQPTPEVLIENDTVAKTFSVTKALPQNNGSCSNSKTTANAEVEAFQYSQLAAFEGRLHDKVLNLGEFALDNRRAKIVCKMNLGPLTMLNTMLSGAVVLETDEPLVWNSRLDFTKGSEKTQFLQNHLAIGSLVQTAKTLEFQTNLNTVILAPSVYQLMHIQIDRSYQSTLSPSISYGKKIYSGRFQYYYSDSTKAVIESVSTAAMESSCFVDDIDPSGIKIDTAAVPYDFTQALLSVFSTVH